MYNTTMNRQNDAAYRDIFAVVMAVAREIRCCSQDETFYADVTFRQFCILDAVAKDGQLGLAELHNILAVEKSTTTRLVDPLIRKGLLHRVRSQQDSRAVRLILTEAGRETHEKVWSCLAGFFQTVDTCLSGDRREAILEAVRQFAGALKEATALYPCRQEKG
ncbi:MAG: DNA-binding transcriptional repressor MarR [Syntrophaceae bacterium PtaU1.Bin231]|nr:MAG: DNA-binding transcriptional repressor MarR [Syntrophaceae bacterium PtaU1.Bin231]